MFITFEGIDLAGKTTQLQLLARYLVDNGYKVITLREPGGTEVSEKIREVLLSSENDLTPLSELFLFEAARADLVSKVLKPMLQKGVIVLCDRFWDSTIAYQGYGRNLPLDFIKQCNILASDGIEPDLTFLLEIPYDKMLERARMKLADRMESEPSDFILRVINGFRELAKMYPHRIVIIDGTEAIEKIHHKIVEVFNNKFRKENGKKFGG
jgi:dTMP kinase